METLIFWKNYSKPERLLLLLSGIVLFTCFSIYFYRFYVGVASSIEYELNHEVERTETPYHSFQILGEQVDLNSANFLVRTFFSASEITFNALHSKIYLGFIILGLSFLLTGISSIKKSNWFAGAMTAIGALLYFFSFDMLGITNDANNTVFSIGFLFIAAIVFALNYFKENRLSVLTRFITLLAALILFFTTIILTATVADSVLYITNFSLKSMSFVVYAFALLVGYDILATFFSLVTSSAKQNPKNGLINFLAVAFIYLASLLIFFLNKIHYIDWNITLLNPFILLAISTIVGFWGQQKRSQMYFDVINYKTGGIWVYMGFAILAIATVSYSFQTSNTAIIGSFEEGIIYAHLTMGVTFLLYLLKNFWIELLDNTPVWHKLYSPTKLTHRFTRLVALATIYLLVLTDNYRPVHTWKAGLATAIGDVYYQEGDLRLAEENYNEGYNYYKFNFKAQYMLTMMKIKSGDLDGAMKLFKDMATFRHPNEYAWINMANAHALKKDYYNACYYLKRGLTENPENGFLLHNLAYYMEKENDIPAVFGNYVQAEQSLPETYKFASFGNLLAFASDFAPSQTGDSLLQAALFDKERSIKANKLAAGNIWGKPQQFDLQIPSNAINQIDAAVWINSLNDLSTKGEFQKGVQVALKNPDFFELLNFSLASGVGKQNNYVAADTLLRHTIEAANPTIEQYYYFELAKLQWAFGNTLDAMESFRISYKNQPLQAINDAPLYLAKLYLQNGAYKDGVELLQEIGQFENHKNQANEILYSLLFTEKVSDTISTQDALNIAYFNPWFISKGLYKQIDYSKSSEQYFVQTYQRLLHESETEAVSYLTMIADSISSPQGKSQLATIIAKNASVNNDYSTLQKALTNTKLTGLDVFYKNYFAAVKAHGNNEIEIEQTYLEKAYFEIPFYEPFGLHIVDFFHQTNPEKAYDYSAKVLSFNRGSLAYNLQFIDLALENGDMFYADATLKSIQQLELLSEEDFAKYEILYEQKKDAAVEKITTDWE